MGKMVTLLAVMTFGLGTAAYAGTPSAATSTVATSSNAPSPRTTSLTYSNTSSVFGGAAGNPDVPGATGQTIVRGTSSTIGGDAVATEMERTGALGAK